MNDLTGAGHLANFIRICCGIALVVTLIPSLAPEPVEANQSEFEEALARINTWRSWIGIEPLEMHPSLMDAAQSHADYFAINGSAIYSTGLHNQSPNNPGFTGATMSDRAAAFGYSGSINENIGLSGSMLTTVNWSIATINHRLTIIDPRYQHIGFGAVQTEHGSMEVIKLGTPSWSNTAEPDWQAWPVDGTRGIGLEYLGSAPSPFHNVPYPVGYPITLKYHGGGSVEFHSAELRSNGSPVDILSGVGNGWLSRNTMMILSTDPLQPNTQYQVTVEATANGEPVTHTWTFATGSSNSSMPEHDRGAFRVEPEPEPVELPEGVSTLDPAIQATWSNADGTVANGHTDRSWLWGPDTFATLREGYSNSPGNERFVAYFDKSRMEINDPNGDRSSEWFVTNGLLVRDMIRGAIQTGDHEFQLHVPADVQLAGDDLADNPGAPTYASLYVHSSVNNGHREPDRTGELVTAHLHASGEVQQLNEPPATARHGHYDATTGFNIADVFWDWMGSADHYDWIYAVGHPITDAYWVRTRVENEETWVLVQAFQRRLLTYTPSNPPGWQREMGNVGRHYYIWRYGNVPD